MFPKIFSAKQMQKWDESTCAKQRINSWDLMEHAAIQFVNAILPYLKAEQRIHVFCGSGNNGGDGLAIARLLFQKKRDVHVFLCFPTELSHDCKKNLALINSFSTIDASTDFPEISESDCIIDALFGTGLNRELTLPMSVIVEKMNASNATIFSVDIPSGLFSDEMYLENQSVVKANYTFTFERPKKSFFLRESAQFVGDCQVLSIGLLPEFESNTPSEMYYLTMQGCQELVQPRKRFSHKGTYGHALLIAGSKGKMGAAILAGKAILRGGAGLVSAWIPSCGYEIFQVAVPEAMCYTDAEEAHISAIDISLDTYQALAIGPGLGQSEGVVSVIENVLKHAVCPIVIDADALNCLAFNNGFLNYLGKHCVLTPHPKEFERLTQPTSNSYERLELLKKFAKTHGCTVILKDSITCIAIPSGELFWNTTGNPGMATGGSGDVLTGIITGLLAQGYTPQNAAILGVYFHGKAGDLAAKQVGENQVIASDILASFRLGE
jgi:hydroxyethylthiazole kinase-like uncharacterized protein yjeF